MSDSGSARRAFASCPTFRLCPAAFAQGSLTLPAGSPTPTMKTLQQVEPRTDLQATPAPAGVDTTNAGNLIIKNSASGNTTNHEISAGNIYGAIVDRVIPAGSPTPAPVSGNSAASTTDPWANISY